MTYTFFGFYEDNDQLWAGSAEGDNWQEARKNLRDEVGENDLLIVAVVEGDHTPLEDFDRPEEL